MQMTRFRVQNYKSIEDTDWIKTNEFTTFVGKNEAGKSAIFRGLSKLNPSDGEEYNALKEFPRDRFSAEFENKDWPASSVEFKLESNDNKSLSKISSTFKNVQSVIVTRHYSNDYSISFQPEISVQDLSVEKYLKTLHSWNKIVQQATTATEAQGEKLGQIKEKIGESLSSTIQVLEKKLPSQSVDEETASVVSKTIMSSINEDWGKNLFKTVLEEDDKYQNTFQVIKEIRQGEKWIEENMPQFIYFDRYDVLESAIDIVDFVRKLKNKPDDSKLRITKCLFDHVNLDLEKLLELDPSNEEETKEKLRRMKADERFIRLSSAATEMSNKFEAWWDLRKYEFIYDIDGTMFRVWVRDNLNPSKIELDQRSAGMQYFFSFYLVFLTEAKRAHTNSILLLDEPGLHYHGTAQKKAVEFLENLAKKNQVLYTTHSPFMIDGERFNDVRIVHEDKKTGHTLVSTDVWPKDKDSLFPLQAGLGYSLAQTLFYSKYQLVVEGITDYSILKAMNGLLAEKGMATLDSDIVITPAGGTRNLMPLASMLVGHEIKIGVLLDGDHPGIQKQKDLDKLQVNAILINSFSNKKSAEIEDLFPEELYLDAVKEACSIDGIIFTEDEKNIESITERVEALFARKNYGKFEKWKPAYLLVDWILQKSAKIPNETCKAFESIMTKTNEMLK